VARDFPGNWARDAARDAAWDAAWGAAWGAAPERNEALDRAHKVWLPFVDAFEAGLFIFWVCPDEIVAVPRPVMLIEDDRLHCDHGPAVHWPTGERYWYWRGLQVEQRLIESPETLTPAEIWAERNIEIRRVMMDRYGYDRLLKGSKAQLLDESEFGRLWVMQIDDDEDLVVVEVVNSTAEPDGSFKDYFLRVPLTVRTAREAVAWTFDVPAADYEVAVET
jgi:hypothetical protein